jgi:predicted Fe-Mo cluster-binding NifX family protein
MSEGVVVAAFGQRYEAETAAGFLKDEGILAAIFADDGGGSYPVMGSAGVRVVVPEEDAKRAREVLNEAGMLEG